MFLHIYNDCQNFLAIIWIIQKHLWRAIWRVQKDKERKEGKGEKRGQIEKGLEMNDKQQSMINMWLFGL